MKAKCGVLLFALVAAVASPVEAQAPSDREGILVLGQKLKDVKVRGKIKKEHGVRTITYRITKSTGDADVDQIVLQASDECGAQALRQVGQVDRAELNKEWNACVKRRADALVAELYDRRSNAPVEP
jgi:hypothetical protein